MRSTESRGYSLLVAGNIVSTFGSSIYLVALVLYLARATDSPGILGLVQFLAYLPAALIGPFAGALVDRWNRKSIIVWTDIIRGGVMLAAAGWGVLTGSLPVWLLLVATVVVSGCGVFFAPAVQAIIPDLVAVDRLKTANATRSATTQTMNLIGSAVGGVLFLVLGTPMVLTVNGLSFLVSGLSETFIRPAATTRGQSTSVLQSVKEGFRYLIQNRRVQTIAFIQAGTNLLLPPLLVTLPFVLRSPWNLPDSFFGYLLATSLLGGVIGYAITSRPSATSRQERAGYLGGLAAIAASIGLLAATFVPGLSQPAMVAMIFPAFLGTGAGIGSVYLIGTTWLQRLAPEQMRGRVFAAVETMTAALLPVAYILSGLVVEILEEHLWVIFTLAVFGTLTLFQVARKRSPD